MNSDVENPFVYGGEVTGEKFADRRNEMDMLKSAAKSGQNVIMYSIRNFGKTSLVKEFMRRNEDQFVMVFIQTHSVTSRKELASRIINAVVSSSFSTLEKAKETVQDVLSRWRPEITLRGDEIAVDLLSVDEDEPETLRNAFAFPGKVANRKDSTIVFFLDEFQEVEEFDGDKLQKMMRAEFQAHENVAYVFMGSKRSIIRDIFENPDKPFYEFGVMFELGPIPRKGFAKFIKEKFKKTNLKISDTVIQEVLKLTKCHPQHTQQLCREMWELRKKRKGTELGENLVRAALERILSNEFDRFEGKWMDLARNQRALLKGLISVTDRPYIITDVDIYSKEFINRYSLKAPSNVQTALEGLNKKEIMDKNQILNPFFAEWIYKNII